MLGFLNAALLMGLHAKHTPMDKAVHAMLFLAMLATTLSCLLEAVWRSALLASIARAAAVAGQGVWFWIAARMLFEGEPAAPTRRMCGGRCALHTRCTLGGRCHGVCQA